MVFRNQKVMFNQSKNVLSKVKDPDELKSVFYLKLLVHFICLHQPMMGKGK